MSKTFTLSEAQTLLPVLESLLRGAQKMAGRVSELESEMQELNQRIFLSGGMHVDVVAAAKRRGEREKAIESTKETLAEIDSIGVQVQSLEDGLLDFPCMVSGDVVMLCWKIGEPGISHWHGLEEEFSERKPLDARFDKSERERLN
ncbi:hypothetical protein HDF16_000430 [Granulicella aggregans]|uniref:DUF2203 family protein n=1 Tax=Granulicella aggregans TaxID=474949 RepID=A0A7W7Z9E0_9BACT|nr:DUF2203 domain-containing protein [Granulicella aggregans]MBB5055761.1 hypothetical protein [Granulicella aggregans]